ncbi:hypothetical protein B566_EDAN012489 [Ephemera danica]|nr:hypothetical protein B566_EDAN012489 [Ephemera danica]
MSLIVFILVEKYSVWWQQVSDPKNPATNQKAACHRNENVKKNFTFKQLKMARCSLLAVLETGSILPDPGVSVALGSHRFCTFCREFTWRRPVHQDLKSINLCFNFKFNGVSSHLVCTLFQFFWYNFHLLFSKP